MRNTVRKKKKQKQKKKQKIKRNGFGLFKVCTQRYISIPMSKALLFHEPAFKNCQDHFFFFEAFDISNRRGISCRHGVALARNYLYPYVVVLVAAVVYPYCCSNLIRHFLWPEQQNEHVCRLCAIRPPEKSGPGPCGRSVCIPPTHLCPTPQNEQQQQNFPKKLRGEKKKKLVVSAKKEEEKNWSPPSRQLRVMMKERNKFLLMSSFFYYYAL